MFAELCVSAFISSWNFTFHPFLKVAWMLTDCCAKRSLFYFVSFCSLTFIWILNVTQLSISNSVVGNAECWTKTVNIYKRRVLSAVIEFYFEFLKILTKSYASFAFISIMQHAKTSWEWIRNELDVFAFYGNRKWRNFPSLQATSDGILKIGKFFTASSSRNVCFTCRVQGWALRTGVNYFLILISNINSFSYIYLILLVTERIYSNLKQLLLFSKSFNNYSMYSIKRTVHLAVWSSKILIVRYT